MPHDRPTSPNTTDESNGSHTALIVALLLIGLLLYQGYWVLAALLCVGIAVLFATGFALHFLANTHPEWLDASTMLLEVLFIRLPRAAWWLPGAAFFADVAQRTAADQGPATQTGWMAYAVLCALTHTLGFMGTLFAKPGTDESPGCSLLLAIPLLLLLGTILLGPMP